MSDEHWATFSIYDHRTPLYRQALLLFDRVVIPIPTETLGDLDAEELDALNADAEYLHSENAAVPFAWDPATFQSWQASVASEALASTLNRDPLYATRLQLSEQAIPLKPGDVDSVVAVPVYRGAEAYDGSTEELRRDGLQDSVLLEVVLPRMPVPAADAPLERIVELRRRESYQEATFNLRKWQEKLLPELLKDPSNKDKQLRAAATDFDRWIRQYAEAVSDANFAKVKTGVVSVLAMGAVLSSLTEPLLKVFATVASPLFSLHEIRKPSWKVVAEKQCAPAAIIYEAAELE